MTIPILPAAAWAAHAPDLAKWAFTLMVNRTDVWGGYHALADRAKIVKRDDGTGPLGTTTTRPMRGRRGRVVLTPAVLAQHFRGATPEHIVGLHTTSPRNTSRWGAVEVDQHGDASPLVGANLAAAMAWYERLRSLGFRQPLLSDSNGRGGYHLLTIFSCPVPTARVFHFLRWLARDYAAHGLPVPPETFPKQSVIQPGRYGNWLRLPGRHHTREHWSRVWDGARWLEGAAAAAFILGIAGNNAAHIPAEALAFIRPVSAPAPRSHPSVRLGTLGNRIQAYIGKLPTGLGEGQRRDDFAFGLACFLCRDLALMDVEALPWLSVWDSRQTVPKGETRLREIIDNAKRYGQRPLGCGLNPRVAPPRGRHFIITTWGGIG